MHFHFRMIWLLCLALMISSSELFAQEIERVLIQGSVFSDSGDRLPGANVLVVDLQMGTTTDDNGEFSLQVPIVDMTLSISYVGYNSRSIRISRMELMEGKVEDLRVQLTAIAEEVGTAVIIGEKRTIVVEELRESVLDFEFLKGELLVLISSKKGYRVQRYTPDLKKLGAMMLTEKPVAFFRDCFDGIHIRYRTHADELELLGKALQVKASYDIQTFREILTPCIASTKDDLFFKSVERSNQKVTYFSKNRASKKSLKIHVVEDEDRLAMIQGTREHISDLQYQLATEVFDTPSDRLAIERDIMQYEWFDRSILSQMTYHPLFEHNDTLYIFDHLRSFAFQYLATGEIISKTPIIYHLDKRWGKKVLKDISTGDFYAEMVVQGISSLYRLDPIAGEHQYKISLQDHTFPEHLKIRDGQAWYVHQDLNQSAPGLYRVDIPK